jgi:hypothetical protein
MRQVIEVKNISWKKGIIEVSNILQSESLFQFTLTGKRPGNPALYHHGSGPALGAGSFIYFLNFFLSSERGINPRDSICSSSNST